MKKEKSRGVVGEEGFQEYITASSPRTFTGWFYVDKQSFVKQAAGGQGIRHWRQVVKSK